MLTPEIVLYFEAFVYLTPSPEYGFDDQFFKVSVIVIIKFLTYHNGSEQKYFYFKLACIFHVPFQFSLVV